MVRNKYVKDTDYNNVFNLLAHNYWREYYINQFENSKIYKKIHDAACNGSYEIKLENVKREELQMLDDFNITYTISTTYDILNFKNIDRETVCDITVSWEN